MNDNDNDNDQENDLLEQSTPNHDNNINNIQIQISMTMTMTMTMNINSVVFATQKPQEPQDHTPLIEIDPEKDDYKERRDSGPVSSPPDVVPLMMSSCVFSPRCGSSYDELLFFPGAELPALGRSALPFPPRDPP
eukprot:TRINITY_DN7003_c0_g1_i1.p1 TRINITY_DN7003_c0_g1~~TRINITY_DN7003_c0_g1_i1.p1  ORF type:complete len:135 (-),score=23.85 TRINITY_DN7003_c0_g1_i1:38-442(-)